MMMMMIMIIMTVLMGNYNWSKIKLIQCTQQNVLVTNQFISVS